MGGHFSKFCTGEKAKNRHNAHLFLEDIVNQGYLNKRFDLIICIAYILWKCELKMPGLFETL